MPHTHRSVTKKIDILFEDDFFVVLNKPAGLLVIPTPKKEHRTLVSLINQQLVKDANSSRLHPCHRLDRDTSGAIIFAKGKKNQQLMMQQFKERKVAKDYTAVISGRLKKRSGRIQSYIRDLDQKKYQKRSSPKLAITEYQVVDERKDLSVLDIQLITGRTNQVRIHFAEAGHPLLGERRYAFGRDAKVKFRRTALHARQVVFKHPVTKKVIKATAPLPDDLKRLLEK